MSESAGSSVSDGGQLLEQLPPKDASNDPSLMPLPAAPQSASFPLEAEALHTSASAQPVLTSAAPAPALTAGAMLKAGREAAGLHIAALAVALKVPVKKLELLEADDFAALPDAVFVRALAASMCRTLKIDAAPVLAKLPQSGQTRLSYQQASGHATFQNATVSPSGAGAMKLSRPVIWFALVLAVCGLAVAFLPPWPVLVQHALSLQKAATDFMEVVTPVAEAPVRVPPEPVAMGQDGSVNTIAGGQATEVLAQSAVRVGIPQVAQAPALGASSVLTPATTALVLRPSIPSPPVAAPALAPVAPVQLTPPSSSALSTTAAGIVSFRARGESWVQVIDKRGVVVLRKMLLPGELVGATGSLPLSVTVGRADQTEVQVRGQAFDTRALMRDNVARFEVR